MVVPIGTAAGMSALLLVVVGGCSTPRTRSHFRGSETVGLISQPQFLELAKTPQIASYVIGTINRLEFEAYQAKQGTRYCPKCHEELVERRKRVVAPPLPPAP